MEGSTLEVFAETIEHLLDARTRVHASASRSYDELFDLAVRKIDEIAPLNVSRRAQDAASGLGLGDLRSYCWFCSPLSKHKVAGKRLFVWEHYEPVAQMQYAIETLTRPRVRRDIVAILARTKVVWVHRDEDMKLNELRMKSTRPDPARAYVSAGIELIHPWEDCTRCACIGHGRYRQAHQNSTE